MDTIDDMARFLIVDDHPLFREALQSALLVAYPDAETIDARSVDEADRALEIDRSVDLVLLDLSLPGVTGLDGLLHFRARYPRVPVVIVSGHEEPRIIAEALSYGASGYIPKSMRKADLAEAVRCVMGGEIWLPPDFKQPELQADDTERREMIERLSTLTPQQLRVLQMLREGLLNKQIAFELKVGETTVKAHV
ncbi:MAG TPA: response regulator transcription factor, partial [Rhizobiaceae bacterium]|nr:response regulator transcription factor [Rhizobiaceae bacterium]